MSLWGDIITAAIPAVVSAGAGLLQNSAQEDAQDEANELALQQQREDTYLKLRLEALKAKYAQGSGGGGGGQDPNKLTMAERVTALQNQGDSSQSAINNLITAIQNGYSLRGG